MRINNLVKEKLAEGKMVGVICTDETRVRYPQGEVRSVGLRAKEETIAHNLFAVLREFDDLNVDCIYSESFSKDHLDTEDLSIHYLDAFLLETCRGEWDHSLCAFCAVPVVIFNPFPLGLIFGFLILLGNLPFVAIQRYNRIRLLTLRKRRVREMERCKVNA